MMSLAHIIHDAWGWGWQTPSIPENVQINLRKFFKHDSTNLISTMINPLTAGDVNSHPEILRPELCIEKTETKNAKIEKVRET